MSWKSKISLISAGALPLATMLSVLAGTTTPGQAASPANAARTSPALCGAGDSREPGIQGDVPAGVRTGSYNCGVRLVGELPLVGNVQGVGTCAYVRTRDPANPRGQVVHIIDVSDPTRPVDVRTIPVGYASESLRVQVARDRSILVSGSSVYDIKDCLHPVLKGEIKWPPLSIGVSPPLGGGGGSGILPHDLRINHAGTRVYGSQGLWEVDISNLNDPGSWKVTDYRCDILTQVPGPWQAPQQMARKVGSDLCEDAAKPTGANWRMGGSNIQTALMWPQLSHSPDVSGNDKYVYIADQAGGVLGKISDNKTHLHIIDVTQHPVKVVGVTDGPGHGLDWFQTGGHQYVLHSNEIGTGGGAGLAAGMGQGGRGGQGAPGAPAVQGGAPAGAAGTAPGRGGPAGGIASMAQGALNGTSDTCKPYPRPTALGWAFDAVISDVTVPAKAHNVTQLRIAINNPENCAARKASGKDPTVAYHLIDDAMNAHFAAVNFGSAGLRIYDIRHPATPAEVAYFNHGPLVHAGVGYYDAARGLIYAPGSSGFWVLELEPQVRAKLGL